MAQAPSQTTEKAPIDGRRQRTLDSRARIIAAMLELTLSGQTTVSAELVAERANVGLRTVFRHFKDMDSLYREMSLVIERRLRDGVAFTFKHAAWRDRVGELIARRADIFEMITPFKRAEAAHRDRSRFLEQDILRLNNFLRDKLREALPPALHEDPVLFDALDLLLSFEAWERLRREQRLSPRRAREVLEATVARLLAGVEDAKLET